MKQVLAVLEIVSVVIAIYEKLNSKQNAQWLLPDSCAKDFCAGFKEIQNHFPEVRITMQAKEAVEIAKTLVEAAAPILEAIEKVFEKLGDSENDKDQDVIEC